MEGTLKIELSFMIAGAHYMFFEDPAAYTHLPILPRTIYHFSTNLP